MKKITLSLVMITIAITVLAQTPQAFKYQAVARDNAGNVLANQNVSFQISILEGSTSGAAVYVETHDTITNEFGLVNLEIGNGTPIIGTFTVIDWAGNLKFLEVEIDPAGGSNYTSMGTSQLLSVPYALHAENVSNAIFEINDLSDARADTTSVFLGKGAGENDDGNNFNTVLGTNALYHNTIRDNLVAIGDSALFNNGLGASELPYATKNTAVGSKALYANTTGYYNNAIGFQALYSNTEGFFNTATGTNTLVSNTTGSLNIANGPFALYYNTAGSENIANGCFALYQNTEGSFNIANGRNALAANTTGSNNTANGHYALYQNTTGSYNIASGASALSGNTEGFYNTAIGYHALAYNTTGSNNVAAGNGALFYNTTAYSNVAVGTGALNKNTDRRNLVAIGDSALFNNGTGVIYIWDGTANAAVGSKALYSNTTGSYNNAIGFHALYTNTTGSKNTASGYRALFNNTMGGYNTANGSDALYYNTTGDCNTATGSTSLFHNTTGLCNTACGNQALYQHISGNGNTATGYDALFSNTTGSRNTAVGNEAMYHNTTGEYNTSIGAYSSAFAESNTYCTFLGYNASNINSVSLSNSMALGNGAFINGSNQVRIGNYSVYSIGGYANWTNISDKRFKQNINEDVPGLEFIKKLRPVTYNLNVENLDDFLGIPDSIRNDEKLKKGAIEKAGMVQTGFIAQEVEEAAQSLGYDFSGVDAPKNEHDFYGLRYAEFVVPLVKAVQEQQAVIEELKSRIEELERGK